MKKNITIACFIIIIIAIFVFNINRPKKQLIISPSPSPLSTAPPRPNPNLLNNNSYTENKPADSVIFNKAIMDINEKYPWYQKLPIDTNNYRVVYDFSENKFRIRIKKPINLDQIKTIINEALSNLQKIGVEAPIKYYVLDVNGEKIQP